MTLPKVHEGDLLDGDYNLVDGKAWFSIEGLSIWIYRAAPGRVYITAYKEGQELEPPTFQTVLTEQGVEL